MRLCVCVYITHTINIIKNVSQLTSIDFHLNVQISHIRSEKNNKFLQNLNLKFNFFSRFLHDWTHAYCFLFKYCLFIIVSIIILSTVVLIIRFFFCWNSKMECRFELINAKCAKFFVILFCFICPNSTLPTKTKPIKKSSIKYSFSTKNNHAFISTRSMFFVSNT